MMPERWSKGRLAIHMAGATAQGMRAPPPRRLCLPWRAMLWVSGLPVLAAASAVVAWRMLRWGL